MGFWNKIVSTENINKIKKNTQGLVAIGEELIDIGSDIMGEVTQQAKRRVQDTYKNTKKVIEDHEYLIEEGATKVRGLAQSAANKLLDICLKIKELITLPFIKFRTKATVPEAFRIQIKEAKKNSVKVGIFDEENCYLGTVEYESTMGVDSSIRASKQKYELSVW